MYIDWISDLFQMPVFMPVFSGQGSRASLVQCIHPIACNNSYKLLYRRIKTGAFTTLKFSFKPLIKSHPQKLSTAHWIGAPELR